MTVVALTIAGSDPSGGAGVQADLRTFAALGVVGVSAITALTVQNSLGVSGVHPVPADVLAAQLDAVFGDTRVQAVKIGMLGGADQVRTVAAALRRYVPPNVILDPVLASTGGVPLLDTEGRAALLTELMPLCGLITPNVPEAVAFTSIDIHNSNGLRLAAKRLREMGARAVLLKGGHLEGEWATDILLSAEGETGRSSIRLATRNTHGTGCLLSSAIAARLALGNTLEQSFHFAKSLTRRALLTPVLVGLGRGYPDVTAAARALERRDHVVHQQRLSSLSGVYVVTDAMTATQRTHEDVAMAAVLGGAEVVQVREKALPTAELVVTINEIVDAMDSVGGALCVVNDRVDVSLASDADGVHLGPDDMAPADARRLLGPDKLIGVSVATVEEARVAAPHASYFGVGAVFGTQTKADAGPAIGLARLGEIKAAFPHIPVVAIGGINAGNIADVARAGADAAAVVSAVVGAPDMAEATRDLVRRFEAGKASGA